MFKFKTQFKIGQERVRTPRIVLVHYSSRATSNLFANKQRNSLKNTKFKQYNTQTLAPYKNTPLHAAENEITQCRTLLHSYKCKPYIICRQTTYNYMYYENPKQYLDFYIKTKDEKQ